jgi:hypothetical protein
VRAVGLRDAGRLVTGLIRRELDRERLPQDTSGRLDPGQVAPARTADRSVLGCMTDMAFPCERATDRSGGPAGTHIGDLNRALRRNISRPRGYAPPVEPAALRPRARGRRARRPGMAERQVSARTQHAAGKRRERTGNDGQTAGRRSAVSRTRYAA